MTGGLTGYEADQRNCYLTTMGRVTGNPHEIEIWFAVDPEQNGRVIYLLSGGRDRSDWVKNIRRNRAVSLRVGTTTHRGIARVIEPDDPADSRARRLVAEKYQDWEEGYELSRWARESLAVEIVLE